VLGNPPTALSRRAVRAHFSRAAASYRAAAALQNAVEDQLIERLEALKVPPETVLDVGCGPGRGALLLRKTFPRAQIVALDFALPMLAQIPVKSRWNPFGASPVHRVSGDATALPICGDCADLLFSNLCIQWCLDLPALFAEWRRVLKPAALLAFTSFGPDTLIELRKAWAQVDQGAHVNTFFDMHDVGDALLRAGFSNPVLSTERYTLSYPNVRALLAELKAIGATNALNARRGGLGGKSAITKMIANYPPDTDGRVSATYEVVFAQAYAPAHGAPIRVAGAEIASVPVSAIRRRGK
jgi:malonyl-CoA O-methyltransferase